MATAQKIPWEEIKTLYIQNIKPHQLAKRFGVKVNTISHRASLEKWVKSRNIAKMIEGEASGDANALATLTTALEANFQDSLQKRGMATLEKLAHDAEKTAQRITERVPIDDDAEEQRERTLKLLVERVKTTAGLTDAGIGAMIAVNDMAGALSGSKLGPRSGDIDVETTKPVSQQSLDTATGSGQEG